MQISLVLTLAYATVVSCAVVPAPRATDCTILANILQHKFAYSTSMDNYLQNVGRGSIWNVNTEPNGCCNKDKYPFVDCDGSNRITDL